MRRTLLVALACLFATTALADDILLVEYGWNQFDPVTLPADYRFLVDAHLSLHDYTIWDTNVSAFPFQESASADLVADLNRQLTVAESTRPRFFFYNAGQNVGDDMIHGRGFPLELVWLDSNMPAHPLGYHWASYVTPLADTDNGLYGYKLTAVERRISDDGQTIYFYGHEVGIPPEVPEPSAFVLLLLTLPIALIRCRST